VGIGNSDADINLVPEHSVDCGSYDTETGHPRIRPPHLEVETAITTEEKKKAVLDTQKV